VNLKGNRLSHNASTQEKYASKLHQLVLRMTSQSLKEIQKLFRQQAVADSAMDENIGSQARILLNALQNKFIKLFGSKAKSLADQMFNNVDKNSKAQLHSSLKKLTGGLSLKTGIVPKGFEDIASATIAENVSLIKSIPQEYFKQVTGSVMRSITEGRGLKDLIPDIQKYDGRTFRRAKNLALDQTRKAYNTINANRLQALKVTQFEWLHSGGGAQPRESHLKIDGKIFSFENLIEEQKAAGVPEQDRGLPSIPPSCKCTMRPIIDLSSEQ
jgi:SPP1 gp7 family putative phage head morphogenesis protein